MLMRLLFVLLCIVVIGSCKSNNKTIQNSDSGFVPSFTPGPPVLVYKTKADYTNLVPVMLSDDKSQIISYPAPADIKTSSGYQVPLVLKKGYLLDNRGIGKNVAFLKITYEQYSRLEKLMTLEEMYNLLADKDPLLELCDCGNRKAFTDPVGQVNRLIDDNKLRGICKVLK